MSSREIPRQFSLTIARWLTSSRTSPELHHSRGRHPILPWQEFSLPSAAGECPVALGHGPDLISHGQFDAPSTRLRVLALGWRAPLLLPARFDGSPSTLQKQSWIFPVDPIDLGIATNGIPCCSKRILVSPKSDVVRAAPQIIPGGRRFKSCQPDNCDVSGHRRLPNLHFAGSGVLLLALVVAFWVDGQLAQKFGLSRHPGEVHPASDWLRPFGPKTTDRVSIQTPT